ncbi:hypothetical protein V6R21_09400 [Limibacter armeniacum]|uniref:hypothetical protein n=1 Tax=Limibacter armeniacum TaxID=466084 RepID=UPI002FE6693A
MKQLLITILLSINSFAFIYAQWNGVLLVQEDQEQYNIMVDQVSALSGFEIHIITHSGTTERFDLNDTGRLIQYSDKDALKIVRVYESGIAVAGVRKSNIMFSQSDYFERRIMVMNKVDGINGNKTTEAFAVTDNNNPNNIMNLNLFRIGLKKSDLCRKHLIKG